MGIFKLSKKAVDSVLKQGQAAKKSIEEQVADNDGVQENELCKLVKQDKTFVEELKNLRTENETVYKRNGRTCRKIITAAPTRYRDSKGELKEVSNKLLDNGKEIVNEGNSFKVTFDKDVQSGKIFDVQKDNHVVSLSAVNSAKMRGHVCGCKCELCAGVDNIVSATLDDGTEIQYVNLNDRIKENIIVNERQQSYEYNFTLNIGSLLVEEGEHNDLLLKDANTGRVEFIIPAPYMYDANNKYSNNVSYEIDVNGEELEIKVIADATFINADDRTLPVIIDPQLVVASNGENITFSTRTQWLDDDERITYDPTILEVRDRDTIRDAFIYYNMSEFINDDDIVSISLVVTVSEGKGEIKANGSKVNVDGKNIDIVVDLTGKSEKGNFRVEPTYRDSSYYAKFYTAGQNGPRFVIEYAENSNGSDNDFENKNDNKNEGGSDDPIISDSVAYEDENVLPTIKDYNFADRVNGYLYVKEGQMVTTFNSCKPVGSLLPLNIVHIHKADFGNSAYGTNWRLNLNKTLKVASDDTTKDTKYTYTDEFGDQYSFVEKYYYINNGEKYFVDKNLISIDTEGNLTYNSFEIHKLQYCNNFTLISEIDDFKNYEFLEQRQDEQVQLENYINQSKPTLKSYVKVYSKSGEIVKQLNDLTKDEYFSLVSGITETSNYLLMTRSDACQLQSLYTSKNQLNTQLYQINMQRSQYDLQKQQLELQLRQFVNQRRQICDQITYYKASKTLSEKSYADIASVKIDSLSLNAYVTPSDKNQNPNEERNATISKAKEYLSHESAVNSLFSLNGTELYGQLQLLDEQKELVQQQVDSAQGQINAIDGQISDCQSQVKLLENQISVIIEQSRLNLNYIKDSFIKYFQYKEDLDFVLKQTPINYLQDENGIISGFNTEGNLVMLCDAFNNGVVITYNSDNLVAEIYDSENKVMSFEYANGLLQSITDINGHTTKFEYDGSKLCNAVYADGGLLSFKYSSSRIASVNYSDESQLKLSYDKDGKLNNLMEKRFLPASGTVEDISISYVGDTTTVTVSDGSVETYTFDEYSRVVCYKKSDCAHFYETTTSKYEYANGKKVTNIKTSSTDEQKEVEIYQYNEINQLISKINDWRYISDKVRIKTETEYEYNSDNQLISETAVKFIDKSGEILEEKHIKNYFYNMQGALTLVESYVEGEENITGKSYEQKVYDENGSITRTISWNSLDSSSKFYSESDYSENGQQLNEKDELGEIYAEYEYESGTNTVNSIKYANGSKLAYGRNPYDGTITSVTQSTDNGEENKTDIIYQYGLPVEVKSGNTKINYTYDHKGRKKSVSINGVLQSEYSYEDYKLTSSNDIRYEKKTSSFIVDGKTIKGIYLKQGSLDADVKRFNVCESFTIGKDSLYIKNYNCDGELTDVTYASDKERIVNYEYDSRHNLIQAQTVSGSQTVLTENYKYNEYGEIEQKILTSAVTQTYTFVYKNTAARELDHLEFGDYKFKLLTDVNGRGAGKEIYNGANKIAAEYISYRKVGDHATNKPAAVWFGSGEKIMDSIKYKYDKCGNIIEITENGHIAAKYNYDSLNRLVREDNKLIGKTVLYSYDQCGNITERCEYDYTFKTGEELSELECTHYSYDYEGDKLVSYNDESFAYNTIGNPTTYRGKLVEWQYGVRLTKLGGTTFAYDGLGRRIKKGNIEFTYDSDGRLLKQSNGLEFVYDNTSVIGVKYGGEQYFYRKDVQGNIIAILDNSGAVIVKYVYDGWGNHAIVAESGEDVISGLGVLNPFRYRGYYYDTETGLYYLQTRYYDPELGRFISQDSIDYAEPETINGLNLYAYCGDNPIMNVDPTGTSFLVALIVAAIIAGVVAGTISAVSTAAQGGSALDCLGSFVGGFITGAVLGAATVLGAGFAVGAITATAATVIGTAAFLTVGTFAAGMGAYAAESAIKGQDITADGLLKNGAITFAQGLLSFGIGMAMGSAGFYDNLKPGNGYMDAIKYTSAMFKTTVGTGGFKTFWYGTLAYLGENSWSMVVRSFMKSIFTAPWNLIKP